MSVEAAWSRFTPANAIHPPGLRPAPDGGPPLPEESALPMPVELSFGALLANLNPLHHIPIIGWVYRAVTGETVHPAFRALGGFLFGGPIGAVVSAVGAMVEHLVSGRREGGEPVTNVEPSATALNATGDPVPSAPLAARLGARAYPAPAQAFRPTLAAARQTAPAAGDPDFAQKVLRGLEAYERTLRARQGLPPPEPARSADR